MRRTTPVKLRPYEGILRSHVLKAARQYDQGQLESGFGSSTRFDVVVNRKPYPPKMLLAIAHRLATGEPLDQMVHGGWLNTVPNVRLRDTIHANNYLYWLNFRIIPKGKPLPRKFSRKARLKRAATRFEGVERRVFRLLRSRNPTARAECIAFHGTRCACCSKRLSDIYGPIAKDYVQVHHRKPIHKARGRRAVDPKADLCPVCPNCHIVLHLRKPELSVEQLCAIVNRHRG